MSRESEVSTPPLPEDSVLIIKETPTPPPPSPPPPSNPVVEAEIKQLTNIVTEMRDSIFALNYQLQQQQQFIENVPSKKKALTAPPEMKDTEETKTTATA